jgi:phosphatidylserine/phosphatidylglycerophosphate/cardiolipin synthase-like enzyme
MNLKNIIIENLNNTKHNVTGLLYKFDDKDVFDTMKRIGQEGVQYDLICDENAYDMASQLANWGNISLFKNVDWYKKLHAKAILFDDLVLLVGSFNLDKSTFSTNMEIIVEITSKSYINMFKDRFNELKILL